MRYNSTYQRATKPKASKAMHVNVKKEIQGLLDAFLDPSSLDLVAKSMFRRNLNIPSDKWSALNRLIMMRHNSFDARGPKAWIQVDRRPEKGGYFSILAPVLIKKRIENPKPKQDPFEMICIGFRPILVWPVEKTSGKDIDYKVDQELPSFFGKEVAEAWGIKIKQAFENPSYYAFFSKEKKEIVMATADQQTFFHELMHAADSKIQSGFKNGQDSKQEIVAEFGAAILMRMFGMKSNDRSTYDYIDTYAKYDGRSALDAVIPLINRISKAINLILSESDKVGN